MLVITLNRKSIKKIAVTAVGAVALAAVAFTASAFLNRSQPAAANGNTVKSTEDMAGFFLGYGIEVNIATAQVSKVNVPKHFDDDFEAFNRVIIESGFDLSRLKGKNIDKWIMEAPSRSQEGETAYAILLVREDKVVGAYLMYQPSGEVTPLKSTDSISDIASDSGTAPSESGAQPSAADAGTAVETIAEGEITADNETMYETELSPEDFPTE